MIMKHNGNGEFAVNWKLVSGVITILVILISVTTWAVTAKISNEKDIEDLQDDMAVVEEEIVPRKEYDKDIERLNEKIDEIHTDVRDIKDFIIKEN